MDTYKTTFHATTDDQQALEFDAYCATEDKTIIEGCSSRKLAGGVISVTVTFLALNRNEAAATATYVHQRLSHSAPTDASYTLRLVRES